MRTTSSKYFWKSGLFFKGPNADLGDKYDNKYSMSLTASNKTRSENYMKCNIIVAKVHHLSEKPWKPKFGVEEEQDPL